jgi:hypothetical protein
MQEFAQDVTVDLKQDQPGTLAAVLEVVAAAKLNIEGYAAIEGLLHFVTKDASAARLALQRAGVRVSRQREVLVVDAPNRVAAAARILRRIAEAGINVYFTYVAANDRVVIGAEKLEEVARLDLSGVACNGKEVPSA